MNLWRRVKACSAVMLLVVVCVHLPAPAQATTSVPALSFREVKITGDEFVVVQADQDISDLSAYWLGYTSSDSATNIVPTQQLPAIALASGQAVLLTSDSAPTCDAVYSSRLSVSLGDTKGMLQLRQLVNTDASTSTFTTVDSVNWTKPSSTGSTTDNLDLRKETGLTMPVWYHDAQTTTGWQVGDFNNCELNIAATTGTNATPAQSYTWTRGDTDAPALIENLAASDNSSASGPVIPGTDIGLSPPQITELLPNPDGTGTDGSDEFIELYNPNAGSFDLTGFTLQTGATTKHSYTFPAGTLLPGKAFVAYYSSTTGLSLSNTSGAADLLDPLGSLLSQTDPYGTAKDGQSWALAKGTWYWTTKPTPNASNVINQPAATSSSSSSSSKKSSSSVKGATTAKTSSSSATPAGSTASGDVAQTTPIHPWTLAVVAALAVGYAVYEYRFDLANVVHRFRRHRALG